MAPLSSWAAAPPSTRTPSRQSVPVTCRWTCLLVLTAKAARLQHAQPGCAAAGKEQLAATVARMAEVLGEGHQQTSKYREALREME